MMRVLAIFLGACLLAAQSSVARTEDFPGYQVIYLNGNASPEVRATCEDLAGFIEKSFGNRPALRRQPFLGNAPGIYIGPDPEHPAFDESPLTDELVIERKNNTLRIIGSDNTVTRMAVYRFIRDMLGWRYYLPGPLGLERLDEPPEPPGTTGPDEILLQTRADYISRNPSFGKVAGPHPWELWHGLRERFQYNHMVHKVATPEWFDTHPEWFAKDEAGQPMKPPFYPKVNGYNDHPDLTNEALRTFIAKQLVEAFQGKQAFPSITRAPGSVSASLGLGDSFIFGTQPDNYPWKPSGYFRRWPDWSNHVFNFSNDLAGRVEEAVDSGTIQLPAGTSVFLGTLAYLVWENVPDFPIHPYIIPYLTFDRSQWYDPQAKSSDLKNVKAWNAKGAPFLGTWDYLFGYGFLIPRSLVDVVSTSIPALHARGVRAYFSQVAPIWPYDAHTNWLTTRLLWDVSADPKVLLNEFFSEFYGPAALPMRHFFDHAEQIWMNQESKGWWLRLWKDPWQVGLWSMEELEQARGFLDTALSAAETQIPDKRRFLERVLLTSELFKLTEAYHGYEHTAWEFTNRLNNFDADSDVRLFYLAQKALEKRKKMAEIRDSLVATSPLYKYARDLSWVFRYDVMGGGLARLVQLSGPHHREQATVLLDEWCRLENFAPTEWTPERPVLHDTRFAKSNNSRIWSLQLLDSEKAAMGRSGESGGFLAENVRRGHIYQLFAAQPGHVYLGEVQLQTEQSLSGDIYIRVDFFDDSNQLIAESKRGRIIPVEKFGESQTIRALMNAPAGTSHGRLFIRFSEMDADSRAILSQAFVHEVGRPASP